MKKSYLLSLIFISFSLFTISLALSLFTSCKPGTTTPAGTTTTTTSPPPPAEVQCDKDSGDTTAVCSERDSCAGTCSDIYAKAREKGECEELTIQQVGELEEIYTVLKSGNKPDLEELSEEEDEYKLSDLKCYLSIGGKGWIDNWITDGASSGDAKNILEWLAENDDVATILADDTNDGEEIVEALLLELEEPPDENKLPYSAPSEAESDDDVNIWGLTSDYLIIATRDNANTKNETIDLNDDDNDIYNALSYFSLDNKKHNIFSYATDKGNQKFFDLTFGILSGICDSAGDDEEGVACKRAMFCWTAYRRYNNSQANEKALADEDEAWDLITKDHETALEEGSDYNDCTANGFYEIFDN